MEKGVSHILCYVTVKKKDLCVIFPSVAPVDLPAIFGT